MSDGDHETGSTFCGRCAKPFPDQELGLTSAGVWECRFCRAEEDVAATEARLAAGEQRPSVPGLRRAFKVSCVLLVVAIVLGIVFVPAMGYFVSMMIKGALTAR